MVMRRHPLVLRKSNLLTLYTLNPTNFRERFYFSVFCKLKSNTNMWNFDLSSINYKIKSTKFNPSTSYTVKPTNFREQFIFRVFTSQKVRWICETWMFPQFIIKSSKFENSEMKTLQKGVVRAKREIKYPHPQI